MKDQALIDREWGRLVPSIPVIIRVTASWAIRILGAERVPSHWSASRTRASPMPPTEPSEMSRLSGR